MLAHADATPRRVPPATTRAAGSHVRAEVRLSPQTRRLLDAEFQTVPSLPPLRLAGGGRVSIDEVAVQRAVSGTPVEQLNRAERLLVVARVGYRRSARDLARLMHTTQRTVVRYRDQLHQGVPCKVFDDVVAGGGLPRGSCAAPRADGRTGRSSALLT